MADGSNPALAAMREEKHMAENNGSGTAAPLDAAAAAKVAFAEVTGEPFPTDIYTAPQLSSCPRAS